MVERSSRTVTRKVEIEVCTTKDGKVFEGYDAWDLASEHESKLENLEALDALFARDPAVVKAALLAHLKSQYGEEGFGSPLWCFLYEISEHLPKAGA